MKKRIRKFLTILIAYSLMVCPVNITASEQSASDSVVLIFLIDKSTEEVSSILTGVVVGKNGKSWVVTSSEISAFDMEKYGFLMVSNTGENAVVYPYADDGAVAYLYSDTPLNLPALPLGSEFDVNHKLYALTPTDLEDEKIICGVMELSSLTEYGVNYLVEGYEISSLSWFGSPVIDVDTATVTAIGTLSNDGAVIKDITSALYYEELSVENWGRLGEEESEESSVEQEKTKEETSQQEVEKEEVEKEEAEKEEAPAEEPSAEITEPEEGKSEGNSEENRKNEEDSQEDSEPEVIKEPQKESSSGILLDENTVRLIALIAVGVVLVILMNRKKNARGRNQKASSGSREDSYSLDLSELEEKRRTNRKVEERIQPTEPYPVQQKTYQLEGVSGIFAGQRFQIKGIVQIGRDPQSCRVLYPADFKGISRKHCTVEVRDGKILLKDLHSSYGTYFQNGDRLEAEVSYQVQSGTLFYLADPKNMFRVTEEWR